MENKNPRIFKCDACSKEILKREMRYMLIKRCCTVERIPLCLDCFDKYGKKMEVYYERD